MASSMISSAPVATASRSSVQATMVAPFTRSRSTSLFPVTKKNKNVTSRTSNGTRIRCMQVWPPVGKKFFETLSYLPTLTDEQLLKEIQYLLNKGWIPCLEFEPKHGFVYRENNRSPGYYDGRYWTMWKLPMFGCTDPAQVMSELQELKKAYPEAFVRILGFDNRRQVQCISFIAHKPKGLEVSS